MKLFFKLVLPFLSIFICLSVYAQNVFTGNIAESDGTPIPGVQILYEQGRGVTSDLNGNFKIDLSKGEYKLVFRHVSFKTDTIEVQMPREQGSLKVVLTPRVNELELISITANKYEKDLMEEPVSVEVIQPALMQQVNTTRVDQVLEKIPGITVADGQVSIRGGSSYAFGAGTRVQMVLDGLPLITADRNDVRWNFFPVEMAGQLEVLKGASSTLYGSSALNGVVHLRTADPTEVPETEITTYYQVYGQPKNKAQAWWQNAPNEAGITFRHARQIGLFDVSATGNFINTNSFIRDGDSRQHRYFVKLRKRRKEYYGLETALLAGFMDVEEGDFLFWENDQEGAFIPFQGNDPADPLGIIDFNRRQFIIQPSLTFTTKKRNKHILNTRLYDFTTRNFVENAFFNQYTADYQYHTNIGNRTKLVAGTAYQFFDVTEPNGIGTRQGQNYSAFLQAEYLWQKFSGSIGLRYEHFEADGLDTQNFPVLRLAGNYRFGLKSSLRASFGQGFRFPSFAEAFVDFSDEAVPIYPNPDLKPEYGWNAEIGYKHQIGDKNFVTYLDAALFVSEYFDMIEFRPGVFLPDGVNREDVPPSEINNFIGIRSENLDRARIAGIELSATGQGKLGRFPFRLLAGYTYTYPVELLEDSDLNGFGTYTGRFFKSIFSSDAEILEPLLRYRQRHLLKADINVETGNFSWGVDVRYFGFVEKIDAFLTVAIQGIDSYRTRNDSGEAVLNLRAAYDFKQWGTFRLIVNNVLNREYSLRYAKMDPPRNFTFQYSVRF